VPAAAEVISSEAAGMPGAPQNAALVQRDILAVALSFRAPLLQAKEWRMRAHT